MFKKIKKYYYFFIILISSLIARIPVWASDDQSANQTGAFQQGVQQTGSQVTMLSQASLPEFAATIVSALLSLLGIVFIILLIYGGFLYMTSQGTEDKIKQAKKLITAAIVGLVIIITAFTISYFVSQALESATGTGTSAEE